jgi:hypothetical protein
MKGITPERQAKWGKGWCDTHKITSTFYSKKERHNKELFEEDNNRIGEARFLESQKRCELLQKSRVSSSPLVSSCCCFFPVFFQSFI